MKCGGILARTLLVLLLGSACEPVRSRPLQPAGAAGLVPTRPDPDAGQVGIRADFDLKAYFGNAWAVYRGAESFDVRIRFLPEAARIVTETQWHATQKATPAPDGSVVMSFQIDGLEEICNWLLGWSGRAEVLEPKLLRMMVADKLRSGLALNQ